MDGYFLSTGIMYMVRDLSEGTESNDQEGWQARNTKGRLGRE
jgi:hypothetical protein